jgi:acetolactate synthase I/III small subunit
MPDIVYDIPERSDPRNEHPLAVLVDNEFGVLGRVIGLFSSRGYNITSLTVAEVDEDASLSRITIVTKGTEQVIQQIISLLERMVPVHKVHDLSREGAFVQRELALVKVRSIGEQRVEAMRIADIFRARSVDATIDSFVFELTGKPAKIDSFIDLLRPLGLIEVARTGAAAMSRGSRGFMDDVSTIDASESV